MSDVRAGALYRRSERESRSINNLRDEALLYCLRLSVRRCIWRQNNIGDLIRECGEAKPATPFKI